MDGTQQLKIVDNVGVGGEGLFLKFAKQLEKFKLHRQDEKTKHYKEYRVPRVWLSNMIVCHVFAEGSHQVKVCIGDEVELSCPVLGLDLPSFSVFKAPMAGFSLASWSCARTLVLAFFLPFGLSTHSLRISQQFLQYGRLESV